jgi:hypothetical protein
LLGVEESGSSTSLVICCEGNQRTISTDDGLETAVVCVRDCQ